METRASARPGWEDDAVDYSQFHQRHLLDKREPRQPAASPIAITTFIADFAELLIGDLTGTRKTRVSLFCLLYTSPSPRDKRQSRMPSSA